MLCHAGTSISIPTEHSCIHARARRDYSDYLQFSAQFDDVITDQAASLAAVRLPQFCLQCPITHTCSLIFLDKVRRGFEKIKTVVWWGQVRLWQYVALLPISAFFTQTLTQLSLVLSYFRAHGTRAVQQEPTAGAVAQETWPMWQQARSTGTARSQYEHNQFSNFPNLYTLVNNHRPMRHYKELRGDPHASVPLTSFCRESNCVNRQVAW